jgi:hypothetical protein
MNIEKESDILFPKIKDISERFYESSYAGISIIIDRQTGYINATKFCDIYGKGKRFRDWKKNAKSLEYINAIEKGFKENKDDKTFKVCKGYPYEITNEFSCKYTLDKEFCNEVKGTYVHEKLLLNIFAWCKNTNLIAINDELKDLKQRIKESFINRERKDIENLAKMTEDVDLSTYVGIGVCYIIYIPKNDKNVYDVDFLFKFGQSTNIVERLARHRKDFGEDIKLIYIFKTLCNIVSETKFSRFLKSRNLLINWNKHDEMFATTENYNIYNLSHEYNRICNKKISFSEEERIIEELKKENQNLKEKYEILEEMTKLLKDKLNLKDK